MEAVLGVDIGTSSSKGVLVALDGRVLATATREHAVARPAPGFVEMPPETWWAEFCSLARELTAAGERVLGVGVSGMGPCVAMTDEAGTPLRQAILYGVDTRARAQIDALEDRLGVAAVLERCGSALSSQSVGPKLAWLNEHEPHLFARARRLFMPASWLVWNLTGQYVLDHHSASQCTPLYDIHELRWHDTWSADLFGEIERPPLVWADATVGDVSVQAAARTGLPAGIPVISGTIDAWTEAVSVDAQHPGDLMIMYGTTMFFINTVARPLFAPPLWATTGATAGTRCLAGGMAASGAITNWLRDLLGRPHFDTLLAEADASGPGARGLLLLPHLAGERTPIADPDARGVLVGLSLQHTRGDLYRAALEATAFGARHNIDAIRTAGGAIDTVTAVGGGTRGRLWTEIVSSVTGLAQQVRRTSIGASYGAAYLAAHALDPGARIADWNPVDHVVEPDMEQQRVYDERYRLYLELYPATARFSHALADTAVSTPPGQPRGHGP